MPRLLVLLILLVLPSIMRAESPSAKAPPEGEPPRNGAGEKNGRVGVRYFEIGGFRDVGHEVSANGYFITSSASLNLPVSPHWDIGLSHGYYTFSELGSNYGNSVTSLVRYHRRMGAFAPYVQTSATATRYHSPNFENFDYGYWRTRAAIEYVPIPRLVLDLGGGMGDGFDGGDRLAFYGNASATLWIWGPVGLHVSGLLGEQGETATTVGAVARLRF